MAVAAMLAGTVHQSLDLALGGIAPFNCQVYDGWCAFLGCRFHADKPCLRATYHGGAGREANLIFVLPPNVYGGPPVGGLFWFQIFIQALSLEIWRKTISGAEGGCWRGKWGGLFWATSLEKIIDGLIAIISFRPGGWMQQSAVPSCAILSVGSTAR